MINAEISKRPISKKSNRLDFYYFNKGRDAFGYILNLPAIAGKTILIPAYIGFSKVEGSGVFDPIQHSGIRYIFYRLNGSVNIDMIDLTEKISKNPGSVLLLIHYFGFKDRNIEKIKKIARKNDFIIIEDFAHALFTFFRAPLVDFDFAIFSLHKMLPYPNRVGGMLLARDTLALKKSYVDFYRYNIFEIIRKRKDYYNLILKMLRKHNSPHITILRKEINNAVPQSFPILLKDKRIRDNVYFSMNQKGFGLVSLYHQLIAPINETYRQEWRIANRITNLPVHQEAEPQHIKKMISALLKIVNEQK